jgi:flagellar biosynthesis component FlhA
METDNDNKKLLKNLYEIFETFHDTARLREQESESIKGELILTLAELRDTLRVDISGFAGLLRLVQHNTTETRELSAAIYLIANYLTRDIKKTAEAKKKNKKKTKERTEEQKERKRQQDRVRRAEQRKKKLKFDQLLEEIVADLGDDEKPAAQPQEQHPSFGTKSVTLTPKQLNQHLNQSDSFQQFFDGL